MENAWNCGWTHLKNPIENGWKRRWQFSMENEWRGSAAARKTANRTWNEKETHRIEKRMPMLARGPQPTAERGRFQDAARGAVPSDIPSLSSALRCLHSHSHTLKQARRQDKHPSDEQRRKKNTKRAKQTRDDFEKTDSISWKESHILSRVFHIGFFVAGSECSCAAIGQTKEWSPFTKEVVLCANSLCRLQNRSRVLEQILNRSVLPASELAREHSKTAATPKHCDYLDDRSAAVPLASPVLSKLQTRRTLQTTATVLFHCFCEAVDAPRCRPTVINFNFEDQGLVRVIDNQVWTSRDPYCWEDEKVFRRDHHHITLKLQHFEQQADCVSMSPVRRFRIGKDALQPQLQKRRRNRGSRRITRSTRTVSRRQNSVPRQTETAATKRSKWI